MAERDQRERRCQSLGRLSSSGSIERVITGTAGASTASTDAAFFERILDDDYVGVGPDGATRNKAEEIAEVKRLDSIKKFEFDDLRVSGNDDVAFATFLATVHFQTNGQDSTAQYRYTVNFIKRDGQLKIAAIHMTLKH